jgi:NAD(P)-dependent dehydrogenase (short-subunit alcohol dehydrogenase family)
MRIKRKTVIVTGAARAIGTGVTNAFIERGYSFISDGCAPYKEIKYESSCCPPIWWSGSTEI